MGGSVVWMVALATALPVVVGQLPPAPKHTEREVGQTPALVVTKRKQDIGTILEGDKAMFRWLLENRGEADLVIKQTKSDCGCAVVKLTDAQKTIRPGKSFTLEVEFDSTRRRGPQKKSVTVYTNDPVEPVVKLELIVLVEFLYEMKPLGIVNLRAVQRGAPVSRNLEIVPGKGYKAVRVLGVEFAEGVPLTCRPEPFEAPSGVSQRIHFSVTEHASIGTLSTKATFKLEVDGLKRTRVVPIRAEVVGDLTFVPKVLDVQRQRLRPGKRLGPVTIRSTDKMTFEILGVTAGPLLDASFEAKRGGSHAAQYDVYVTVRKGAPPGPFGATLEVRTSSLDQPLVRVPVFGIVAPIVEVDPPLVRLRQDGTAVGTKRRVKVQTSVQDVLNISRITCANQAVVATIDQEASSRYQHLRFLNVELVGQLSRGTHETVLTLTTSLEGARQVEIPVVIEVPD